jgi:hypothetical protein
METREWNLILMDGFTIIYDRWPGGTLIEKPRIGYGNLPLMRHNYATSHSFPATNDIAPKYSVDRHVT